MKIKKLNESLVELLYDDAKETEELFRKKYSKLITALENSGFSLVVNDSDLPYIKNKSDDIQIYLPCSDGYDNYWTFDVFNNNDRIYKFKSQKILIAWLSDNGYIKLNESLNESTNNHWAEYYHIFSDAAEKTYSIADAELAGKVAEAIINVLSKRFMNDEGFGLAVEKWCEDYDGDIDESLNEGILDKEAYEKKSYMHRE